MIRRERKQILGVENERSSNPPVSASWFSSTAAHMRRSKRPGTRSSWAVPMLRRRSRRPVRKDFHFKPLFFLTRNKADVSFPSNDLIFIRGLMESEFRTLSSWCVLLGHCFQRRFRCLHRDRGGHPKKCGRKKN